MFNKNKKVKHSIHNPPGLEEAEQNTTSMKDQDKSSRQPIMQYHPSQSNTTGAREGVSRNVTSLSNRPSHSKTPAPPVQEDIESIRPNTQLNTTGA